VSQHRKVVQHHYAFDDSTVPTARQGWCTWCQLFIMVPEPWLGAGYVVREPPLEAHRLSGEIVPGPAEGGQAGLAQALAAIGCT
jgi:hypothetical protein